MQWRYMIWLVIATVSALGVAAAPFAANDRMPGFGDESIGLVADESAVQVGLEVTLTATLSDEAEGVSVQFTVNDEPLGGAVNTNGSGEATKIYAPSAKGTVTIKATATDYDGSNTVEVTGVDITLKARSAADSNWVEGNVTIASGGVNNDPHKAVLLVEDDPPVSSRFQISLAGGRGHGGSNNASAAIGGVSVGPGETKKPKTGAQGNATGYLLSSNVLASATVTAGTSKQIDFAWNNYAEDDFWVSDPIFLVPGESSDEVLTLQLNSMPLEGHEIAFFVEEVVYFDENGDIITLTNTASEPSDLSSWASFADVQVTVDGDGRANATLVVEDKPEIVSLTMRAYDQTVFTMP